MDRLLLLKGKLCYCKRKKSNAAIFCLKVSCICLLCEQVGKLFWKMVLFFVQQFCVGEIYCTATKFALCCKMFLLFLCKTPRLENKDTVIAIVFKLMVIVFLIKILGSDVMRCEDL